MRSASTADSGGPGRLDSASALQLVLDLPLPDGDRLEDFLRSPANASALDAVLAWPDWPSPAVLLWGPSGSGRSHLARIWARASGAAMLNGNRLGAAPGLLAQLGATRHCVVDDADQVQDDVTLFHLYNLIAGQGGQLLLTACRPLGGWGIELPDLSSRLRTAWSCRIGQPDDALLEAVLVKQLQDRQLMVLPGVLSYLVSHMERSFAAARRLVRELDRASLRARRPITLPLARAVLATDAEGDVPEAFDRQQPGV
jgi:DnaA regulatory inactivator Hda